MCVSCWVLGVRLMVAGPGVVAVGVAMAGFGASMSLLCGALWENGDGPMGPVVGSDGLVQARRKILGGRALYWSDSSRRNSTGWI